MQIVNETSKQLIPEAELAQLVENGRLQAEFDGEGDDPDFHPVTKLFNPVGRGVWLLTAIAPHDHSIAWGLCDLGQGCPEYGAFSLTDLAAIKGPLGLGIERDRYFKAKKPMSAYLDDAMERGKLDA
jgi:hypothetical protein